MKPETKPTEKTTEPQKRNWIKGKIAPALITAGIIGATLGGLYVNDLPPFQHRIELSSSTFDPNALKGIIGESNSVQLTAEEYSAIAPPIIEGTNFNIPMGISFKDGKPRNINYEITYDSRDFVEKNNTQITINGLQEGDMLISPVDGKIIFDSGVWPKSDGSFSSGGYFITAVSPDGVKISLVYSTTGIKPLINSQSASVENEDTWMPVKKGDPIGILTTSAQHDYFKGQVRITVGSAGILSNIRLATTSDGKAIVLR
jgi:hypothetical protein